MHCKCNFLVAFFRGINKNKSNKLLFYNGAKILIYNELHMGNEVCQKNGYFFLKFLVKWRKACIFALAKGKFFPP
jgi:hypothetical protein